jgi:hypothetical protein
LVLRDCREVLIQQIFQAKEISTHREFTPP